MLPDGFPGISQQVPQDDIVPLGRESVSIWLDVEVLADDLLRRQAGFHLHRVHVGVGSCQVPDERQAVLVDGFLGLFQCGLQVSPLIGVCPFGE